MRITKGLNLVLTKDLLAFLSKSEKKDAHHYSSLPGFYHLIEAKLIKYIVCFHRITD
jgi:hypothetical protein